MFISPMDSAVLNERRVIIFLYNFLLQEMMMLYYFV